MEAIGRHTIPARPRKLSERCRQGRHPGSSVRRGGENEEPEGKSMVATATLKEDAIHLSSLALEQQGTFIKSSTVLLDGGASHNVYYSSVLRRRSGEETS